MTDTAGQLVPLITPQRRNPDKAPVEDGPFFEMLMRMLRAAEYRVTVRPENLPMMAGVIGRATEIINCAIADNAARYANDPRSGASVAECGRALGISQQAASQRRGRGDQIIAERHAAAGVVKFSEAKREREIVSAAVARGAVCLDTYRARKAA
jgi:hypothetical protein